ncbi:MAG: hypothetical protein ACI4HI_17180, partial [Lachnospiraceae bacterium]
MNSFIIGIMICMLTLYIGMIYTSQILVIFSFAQALLCILAFICLLYKKSALRCHIEIPIALAERKKASKICIVIENRSRIPWTRTR